MDGKKRIEEIEFLEYAFFPISKVKAFSTSIGKKPTCDKNSLTSLKDAIDRCRCFGYMHDIIIFLPYVEVPFWAFERDVYFTVLDLDREDDILIKEFGRKSYVEKTKKGFHFFLYTDKRINNTYEFLEIFSNKWARVTAKNIEPYTLPFFVESEYLCAFIESFYKRKEVSSHKLQPVASFKEDKMQSWSDAKKELIKCGWKYLKEDSKREYWGRPFAKTDKHDACFDKDRQRFQVFTTSADLKNQSYSISYLIHCLKKQIGFTFA